MRAQCRGRDAVSWCGAQGLLDQPSWEGPSDEADRVNIHATKGRIIFF